MRGDCSWRWWGCRPGGRATSSRCSSGEGCVASRASGVIVLRACRACVVHGCVFVDRRECGVCCCVRASLYAFLRVGARRACTSKYLRLNHMHTTTFTFHACDTPTGTCDGIRSPARCSTSAIIAEKSAWRESIKISLTRRTLTRRRRVRGVCVVCVCVYVCVRMCVRVCACACVRSAQGHMASVT